jgi:hypothetical protein
MCTLTNVDLGSAGAGYNNGGCIIVPDAAGQWWLKASANAGIFFAYCQTICFD